MQTYQSLPTAAGAHNVASFVARLMSLSAPEIQCLYSDSELMRHLNETHSLMESRLQNMSLQNKLNALSQQHHQQLQQQQQQMSPQLAYYDYYTHAAAISAGANFHQEQQHKLQQLQAQQQLHHMQQQQHQQSSPQGRQQQQQHLLIQVPHSAAQLALDLRTTPTGQQHQQQVAQVQSRAPTSNLNPAAGQLLQQSKSQHHNHNQYAPPGHQQQQNHHHHYASSNSSLPADLKQHQWTASTASHAQRKPPSRDASPTSARCFNPKKVKLNEYQAHAKQLDGHQPTQQLQQHSDSDSSSSAGNNSTPGCEASQHLSAKPTMKNQKQVAAANITPATCLLTAVNAAASPSPAPSTGDAPAANPIQASTITATGTTKKYKGEFDEPTPAEVEARQRMLARADNYHRLIGSAVAAAEVAAAGTDGQQVIGSAADCACVLGSEFRDKSVSSVLAMIDRWRHLDTEERIKAKWDVSDLPKDIPLADIKKFEELRREASKGRADFGGASKRKPLGIRGTRQFLLILYCLWGHPGRDDIMQKEGYCPHCFAKIKKANEQSTLVRVVNHFNMKHRRGANPRLSPHRDSPPASAATPMAADYWREGSPEPAQQVEARLSSASQAIEEQNQVRQTTSSSHSGVSVKLEAQAAAPLSRPNEVTHSSSTPISAAGSSASSTRPPELAATPASGQVVSKHSNEPQK